MYKKTNQYEKKIDMSDSDSVIVCDFYKNILRS